MTVEKQMNVDWQGKPKFSEKTCPSATFVHHKIHMTRPGFEPGPPRWKPATNRLSYGAACRGSLGKVKKKRDKMEEEKKNRRNPCSTLFLKISQ
jgi:hypothetical protein